MGLMAEKRTHNGWFDYLREPDRKLTLDEFQALELAFAHGLLVEIAAGLGMVPERNDGYVYQLKSAADGALKRAIEAQQRRNASRPQVGPGIGEPSPIRLLEPPDRSKP